MPITLKQDPAMLLLASTHRLTIPEINPTSMDVVPKLYAAAGQGGIPIAGPMVYLYDGIDGNPNTVFELVIGIPISSRPASTAEGFEVVDVPAFDCASMDYIGPMSDIRTGYQQLMDGMREQGLRMSEKCREVYKHWVAFDSPDNVTELQVGIA